ncbi:[FeFe] hydrogenase H-cluster radical SAM maturase HydE [Saccharicrinis sp. FJH54]|uniref:[FeFe] hydrogenase H-cluster radical SAM maturase HydE n=1 Tax=Saccharicrinis sp. FJH54 TaxID=3344665 RepID=UPI0035D50288
MQGIAHILKANTLTKANIIALLNAEGEDKRLLFETSSRVKKQYVDDKVYFRGLIEFSNVCDKNCFYCGIRKDNSKVKRYNLSDEEIVNAAIFAWKNKYASIVMQSGELSGSVFVNRIDRLLKTIHQKTNGELHVTLSCGEQSKETYRRWMESGAHRYLLRIESSNPDLYKKLHPDDGKHRFENRIRALKDLQDSGYQTGTGVMIGLPFQTMDDLAKDLLFMQEFNIDMVGMGPYIEHRDTPLYRYKDQLLPIEERFQLTLKMVAILRIMMKDINIASATALQAIDKIGREKAIKIGANVIMPNITPGKYRDDYKLYENKPCTDENAEDCSNCLEARIALAENEVALGEWGDSKHFQFRTKQ